MSCTDQSFPDWTERGAFGNAACRIGVLAPSLPRPRRLPGMLLTHGPFSSLSDAQRISSPRALYIVITLPSMSHETETDHDPEGVTSPSISVRCLDIVEQYRTNQASKGETIYRLVETIPSDETEAAEPLGQTLESYVSMLDDWDRDHTLSDDGEQRDERDKRGHARGDKRDTAEDDNPDESAHKRPKIDPELFPWTITDRVGGNTLRAECVATKNLIANYMLDIKLAKANLLNSGSAPEYPDSEWRSILSGLPANLDAVFSGRYSTEHESKISQEVGDFTISTREVSTSKSIKSAGDVEPNGRSNYLRIPAPGQRVSGVR